ncbi:MAG: type II toxin-antitoxin system PemK/MazF family toxin [bacterium]
MKRGQIILLNFSPASGHEQKGYRPAVVLSHTLHNEKTGLIVICPITSKIKGYNFEVEINTKKVKGVAIANQVRTMDISARKYKVVDSIPEDVLSKIIQRLKLVIE